MEETQKPVVWRRLLLIAQTGGFYGMACATFQGLSLDEAMEKCQKAGLDAGPMVEIRRVRGEWRAWRRFEVMNGETFMVEIRRSEQDSTLVLVREAPETVSISEPEVFMDSGAAQEDLAALGWVLGALTR